MARDDDHTNNDNRSARNFDSSSPGTNQRQEPTLSRFDVDDDFEEPDRDADYASGYHADDADDVDDSENRYADDSDSDLFPQEDMDAQDEEEDPDAWDEDDEYAEDNEPRSHRWPFSLIAVAVVALVLLSAGGYGVMQQRAATEDELLQLRAQLATTPNPGGDSAARAALEELQLAYDTLATEAEALRLENRTLTDTAAGLQAQLGKQQSTPSAKTVEAQPKPANAAVSVPATNPVAASSEAPQPAVSKSVAAKPVAPRPAVAAAVASGPWFVNFGSYATREMADSWAVRLQPSAGKVIVMPITSAGRTLYRLRVIGLADSASAKQVARKLETELRVAQLWVGKE